MGQNLVPNPSFEEYDNCPTSYGERPSYWTRPIGHNGSSDYYNTCSSIVNPFGTIKGAQAPFEGNGMMGFFVGYGPSSNYREYIQVKLKEPLLKCQYEISFYIALPNNAYWAANGIGCVLSKNDQLQFSDFPGGVILNSNKEYSTELIKDTAKWQKLSFLYSAGGGEIYLTIGGMLDNKEQQISKVLGRYPFDSTAYYFIDNVELNKINFPSLLGDTTICYGQKLVDLNAAPNHLISLNFNLPITTEGLYHWTIQDLAKTCTFLDSAYVDVDSAFINLGGDTSLCQGDSIVLGPSVCNVKYEWSDNSRDSILIVRSGGSYHVKVQTKNCSDSDSISIKEISNLPSITLNDTIICLRDSVTIKLPQGDYTVFWYDQNFDKQRTLSAAGTYKASVYNECFIAEIQTTIDTIDCFCNIFIPNSFSPNYDGTNDFFQPISNCDLEVRSFQIYNRWGELINLTKANYWDGKLENQDCIAGVYMYMLSIKSKNGVQNFSGLVHLLK